MHSQHQQKWPASFQPIHSYLLICASVSEFVFKPKCHEPPKDHNKSSDWCHSAPPRHTACHRALTAPVGKALRHFLKCHLEGRSCKLHRLQVSFFLPLSSAAWSSIHTRSGGVFAQAVYTWERPLKIIQYVTRLLLSAAARTGRRFFPCALRASSRTFYLSAEILSPPALCFNSEKQAGAHLSALPYLQPRHVSRGPRYESGYLGGWEGSS